MKKYAIGMLVALMAVSFTASALADSGKDKKNGQGDEHKSEQGRLSSTQNALKVCKSTAKSTFQAAQKLAKSNLNIALKAAKQVKKDAIVAANGDLVKIDTANAMYRSVVTVAMNVQRVASDAAQTAYDSAVTTCKKQQLTDITSFSFATPVATGVINQTTHTIVVSVPSSTVVTALIPTIIINGVSVSPASGVAQNFTNPVTYTVTSAGGVTQAYVVTVTVLP